MHSDSGEKLNFGKKGESRKKNHFNWTEQVVLFDLKI